MQADDVLIVRVFYLFIIKLNGDSNRRDLIRIYN